MKSRQLILGMGLASTGLSAMFAACTDSYRGPVETTGTGGATTTTTHAVGTGGEAGIFNTGVGGSCDSICSNDLKSVLDCHGNVLTTCTPDQGCSNANCIDDPCKAAEESHSSYGCDYYALKTALNPQADGACFAVFIANTWGKPVHIKVERNGLDLPTESFAYIPTVQGQTVTYAPYQEATGLDIGQVAILFLSRQSLGGATVVDCPMPAALNKETGVVGTGLGTAFHITGDYPVVAYQIAPYGGSQAYVTSATLLLPTSSWDTNYVAVNAYESSDPMVPNGNPSLDILAYQDDTEVTILPKVNIVGSPTVEAAPAGMPKKYTLNAGQYLQITQPAELTGSPIQATKPIGVFGAATCVDIPSDQSDCDSAQQQLAPVKALGSEYAAVHYKDRNGQVESPPYRMVGAVDGTQLEWVPSKPSGAPKTIGLGDVVEFKSAAPFVVKSQDSEHPFYLGGYMTGGVAFNGEGDPDWVNVIPPSQYLTSYVLFTDPTYPETSLVVIRTPSKVDGKFADVTLDCAGKLEGWQSFGSYEYTRVNLVTGNFASVGTCNNGRQEMKSDLPFGVTVWGWGTTQQTKLVSYAYPAGAGFQPINDVVVSPIPK